MSSPFVESFRHQAERLLAGSRRVEHRWVEGGGGWVHLEVPPVSPHGFFVAANVGPEYALVLAGRTLSQQFPVASPGEEAVADERARAIVDFIAALLGPAMRLREQRGGRATYHWLLEERTMSGWRVVSRWWSPLPWHYFGPRHEIVYQNRQLRESRSGAPPG